MPWEGSPPRLEPPLSVTLTLTVLMDNRASKHAGNVEIDIMMGEMLASNASIGTAQPMDSLSASKDCLRYDPTAWHQECRL